MPEFTLYFTQTASRSVTVEAADLEAATEAAYNELPGSLCHQCAGEYEMTGDWYLDEKTAAEDYPQ